MFPDFVDHVVDDDDYYFVVSIGNRGLSQTGKSELGTFVREKGEEPMMEFSFLFECSARKLYPWEITRTIFSLSLGWSSLMIEACGTGSFAIGM